MLDNKLGIVDSITLALEEERLSKVRALELFDKGLLDIFEVGTFAGLAKIHAYLFQDVYDFAGKLRNVEMAKGSFRFAPRLFLPESLAAIDRMPQSTYDEILAKYVEMNVAHPFREGNGRSTRIWLNCILKKALGAVVDWSRISREDYLRAMEQSPVHPAEIHRLLKSSLTEQAESRRVYIRGINASYEFEGLAVYPLPESMPKL